MTLYDFIRLSESEQAKVIRSAQRVADREDKEYLVLLYQIDKFYVEVYYHKEQNVLSKLKPIRSTMELHRYFKKRRLVNLNK